MSEDTIEIDGLEYPRMSGELYDEIQRAYFEAKNRRQTDMAVALVPPRRIRWLNPG